MYNKVANIDIFLDMLIILKPECVVVITVLCSQLLMPKDFYAYVMLCSYVES